MSVMVAGTSMCSVRSLHDPGADSAGAPHDQGHAQSGLVAAVFFEAAMVPEIIAMVGHIDHEGVVVELRAAKGIEHAAHVAVQKGYRGVVGGDDAALVVVAEVAEDIRDLPAVLGTDARAE